jgi:hypothetical protein
MNKVRKIFVADSRRVGAGLHRQDARHGDAFSPRCTSSGTWTTEWLSVEAKDFLAKCMCSGVKAEDVVMAKWVPPKSTLDTAFFFFAKHWTPHCGSRTTRTTCRRAQPTGSGHWRGHDRPCWSGNQTKAGSRCAAAALSFRTRRPHANIP